MSTVVWILLGVSLLLVFLVAIRHLWTKPSREECPAFSDVEFHVGQFFEYYGSGSTMVVRHEETGFFVQFVVTKDRSEGTAEIEMGVPDAPWSRESFSRVAEEMRVSQKGKFRLDATTDSNIPRFAVVDMLRDPTEVSYLIKAAFRAMSIPDPSSEGPYSIEFTGWLIPEQVQGAIADAKRSQA